MKDYVPWSKQERDEVIEYFYQEISIELTESTLNLLCDICEFSEVPEVDPVDVVACFDYAKNGYMVFDTFTGFLKFIEQKKLMEICFIAFETWEVEEFSIERLDEIHQKTDFNSSTGKYFGNYMLVEKRNRPTFSQKYVVCF